MKSESKQGALRGASIVIIVAMFLSLLAVLSVWLVSSYHSSVRRGNERVAAASKIVAANAIWMNSLARQTLHRIDDSLKGSLVGQESIHDLNAAVADLPSQVTAYVLGAGGETLYSNEPDVRQATVTDRDYFARLRNGAEEYTSSLLQSRISGKQIFVFSRRLERNGAFAGVAVISFDAGILRPIWDSVAMGPNSAVGLLRRDGQLVARHPEPEGPIDLRDFVLFTDYMKKSTSGIFQAFSPVDGASRLVGYQIIERTPFVAIASADVNMLMAPFWVDVETAGGVVILATIGALVAAMWIRSLIHADGIHTQQLADALKANEVLMREIHHRVKNNLQTVMALLRMQGFDLKAVQQLNERISAMSAVHEQMYGFDQFKGISAPEFVPDFIRKLVDLHGLDIKVDFQIADIIIAPDRATPFALLLNELIANSMKYAFRDRRAGHIGLSLSVVEGEMCQLSVEDDGPGYDGQTANPGMGTRLIRAFVTQLHGEFSYRASDGTKFEAKLHLGS